MVKPLLILALFASSAFGQGFTFLDLAFVGRVATAAAGGGGGGVTGDPFLTGITAGTPRSDYFGTVGYKIHVGASGITVTHLGRYVLSGNSQTHTVSIYSAGCISSLASVSVNTSGAPANDWKYVALGSSLALNPSTDYLIYVGEFSGGDQWLDFDTTATHTSDATVEGQAILSGCSFSSNSDHGYAMPNFKYTVP